MKTANATESYKAEVIDPGDKASKLAHAVNIRSYSNNPAVQVIPMQPGNFRGPVGHKWSGDLPYEMARGEGDDWVVCEATENDGAGQKLGFHALAGTEAAFKGAAWEIIAMTADDLARSGRFPAIICNEINVKRITPENVHLMNALLRGYGIALRRANLVSITGETAVMKYNVTCRFDTGDPSQLIANWGATCLGLARKDLLITGEGITAGMTVFGFRERGYRCNGGGKLTEIIVNTWGPEPEKIAKSHHAKAFAEALTVPSMSYARAVCEMVGWRDDGTQTELRNPILALAHITGGGVWNKFREILPAGIGADLHSMPPPPPVLIAAQEYSFHTPKPVTDGECYGTFHGGCGMIGVCQPDQFKTIANIGRRCGITVNKVGETIASRKREVRIKSRFLNEHGRYVEPPKE
jgi:phosphoribosylformylglycinamidine cyclo-ligase